MRGLGRLFPYGYEMNSLIRNYFSASFIFFLLAQILFNLKFYMMVRALFIHIFVRIFDVTKVG